MRAGVWPVAGVDEAGRGPLAGPVAAAAVILDPDRLPRGLADSKVLSLEEREDAYERILSRAIAVAIGFSPVGEIDRIPDDLKALYATAFEIDAKWLIEAASRRQKWIDQAQSLNLYIANPSGRKLDALYRLAWSRGLKTTYYLRSRSATHVEKSTLKGTDGKLNSVASATMVVASAPILLPRAATAISSTPCRWPPRSSRSAARSFARK